MASRGVLDDVARIYAHDLRGPLAALDTALAYLTPSATSDDFAFFRDSCADASMRLRQMVDNLETIALLQDEEEAWSTAPADILPELEATVTELGRCFELRELELRVSALPNELWVAAHATLTRIAIRNLILDALEQSPVAGVVVIDSPDATTLRVTDEGAALTTECLPLAERPEGQAALKLQGARISRGFGWVAARLAMERQGGTLELEPAGERGMRATARWLTA